MLKKFFLGAIVALSLMISPVAYAQSSGDADGCYDKADITNALSEASKVNESLSEYVVASLDADASRAFMAAFNDMGGPVPPGPWDTIVLVFDPNRPGNRAFIYIMKDGCAQVNAAIPGIILSRLLQSASN